MLSIDEAIAHAREKAKEIRENIIDGDNLEPYESYCNAMVAKSAEEHEQLAEWLEELKDYQDKNKMVVKIDCANSEEFKDIAVKLAKEQYNKAIDDFVNLAKEHDFKHDKKDITNCVIGFIEFFAEQLQAGGSE